MADPNPTVTIRGNNQSARAFKQARADMASLKRSAGALSIGLGAVAAAGVLVVTRTTQQTRAVIAYADALEVTTESLSQWGFAAEQVGISSEKVGDIMKDAADKIGDAFRNNAGEAKEAVESLGLDLDRLARLSPDEQLLAIAGALETVETNAEKVQIMESIGNDLSLLLPLLENNAEGLREAAERADQLGVTLTGIEAEKIKAADRAIRDFHAVFQSLGQTMTAQLAGPMTDLADWMAVEIPVAVDRVSDAFIDFGAVGASIWEIFNPSDITGQTTFEDAFERNRAAAIRMREELEATRQSMGAIEINPQRVLDENDLVQQKRDELDELLTIDMEHTAHRTAEEQKRLDFARLTARTQTSIVVGEALKLTRGVAHQNKLLFRVNQVAGIADATINAHKGIARTLAEYPYPINVGMAALHAVAAWAEVNAIKSASFGGGGGSRGGGGGGGRPPPTAPSDLGTPINNQGNPRELKVTIEGSGVLSRENAMEIARSLREFDDDGGGVFNP